MSYSLCIKCGAVKKRPPNKCPICQFQPVSNEDKAKSLILSLDCEFFNEYRGKTKNELQLIALKIKAGKPYEFDTKEVQNVIAYAQQQMSIQTRKLLIDGIKWILPPIILLVFAVFLLLK